MHACTQTHSVAQRLKGCLSVKRVDFLLSFPGQVIASAECTDERQKELWVVCILPPHFLYFQFNQCKMYSEMQFSDKWPSVSYLNVFLFIQTSTCSIKSEPNCQKVAEPEDLQSVCVTVTDMWMMLRKCVHTWLLLFLQGFSWVWEKLNVVMWYFSHVVQQVNRLILLGSSNDSKKGSVCLKRN